MILHFTAAEMAAIEALESEYQSRKEALDKKEEQLAPANCPETNDFFRGIDPKRSPEEWNAANKAFTDAMNAWIDSGSEEWKAVRQQQADLMNWLLEQRKIIANKAGDRQFAELKGDTIAIIDDFRKQVIEILQSIYTEEKEHDKKHYQSRSSIYIVSLGDGKWKLYDVEVRKAIKRGLKRHYDAISRDQSIIDSFDKFIDDQLAAADYVAKPGEGDPYGTVEMQQSSKYRTKNVTRVDDYDIPDRLPIPTMHGYQYATSLYDQGNAYLIPLVNTDGLSFNNGKLFFEGRIQALTEMEVQNLRTKEKIEEMDTGYLRSFYAYILGLYQTKNNQQIDQIYDLPAAALAMLVHKTGNMNERTIRELRDIIGYYHNMVGVLYETVNGKKRASYYPVLNFEGYDAKNTHFYFSSPYMNKVIQTILGGSIIRNKNGEPQLKNNGEPKRLPTHSYLIKSSLQSQRNSAAADNVQIIVTLIEQAGDNTPNIKASTIIERNPQLKARLDVSQNKRRLLERVFKKTWELLREHTTLQETYIDIELPDPNNPAFIPNMRTLKTLVFTFPHKGKRK